ncbi:hypothetical protein B0H66DRAFT_536794 [Apodospora peruviana]|uniref:Uncharacterized protein n=1 Tax=Apodospora peruviana TaxID=516989 RepID=A0AAE0LZD0_9PEZI|nr:hypothetical protein B0H66DRAFT_536794 [Apodospora peruviana]
MRDVLTRSSATKYAPNTCPGYRDQLSLMFRDESTKVIQRAHAQWGVSESFEAGEPSGSSPTSSIASPSSSSRSSRTSVSETSSSKASPPPDEDSLSWITVPKEIYANRSDQAIRFFIEHYIVGHPDEPKVGRELQGVRWIHSPQIQHAMAAVGLASMSNLAGDKELQVMARQKYGLTLQQMATSIQNLQSIDLDVSIRTVILLALFEVIRGSTEPTNTARTHMMGAAALLKSILPRSGTPGSSAGILRALLQLCFSMLVPHLVTGSYLPEAFYDWVATSENMASAADKPAAELIRIISRFVHLAISVRHYALADGRPKTSETIREALAIIAQLDGWERCQEGIWAVVEERSDDKFFPAEGVFDGCYHVYTDMWTARVWNHYRWARVMVEEMVLRFIDQYPMSSAPLVSADQRWLSRNCIIRVARDTLVSIPTHYRHPKLERIHRGYFDKTSGGAGMGAAGIPTLLFEIKVAGCAPNLPPSYRVWSRGMLETIWADTGMAQARAMAEMVSRAEKKDRELSTPGGAVDSDDPRGKIKQEETGSPPMMHHISPRESYIPHTYSSNQTQVVGR